MELSAKSIALIKGHAVRAKSLFDHLAIVSNERCIWVFDKFVLLFHFRELLIQTNAVQLFAVGALVGISENNKAVLERWKIADADVVAYFGWR